jgi:hypothetical protein
MPDDLYCSSDELGSALPFGLCDSLFNFSAAVRAFVGEVDLRHAPMGFNISNVHSQQSPAGGADNWSYFDFVVLDVGGHVASPSVWKHAKSSLDLTYGVWRSLIVNSCEHTKNRRTIFVCVAKSTHGLTDLRHSRLIVFLPLTLKLMLVCSEIRHALQNFFAFKDPISRFSSLL